MSEKVEYQTERLDHLGIVAGVCREAGIAAWLDAQVGAPDRRVSVGTAVVAMILNGLGFSNRQLYLVPQFFANKPVEHLLGKGITADMLNDDCLGRTLDWIYEHDPTILFAGLALQARSRFGIKAEHLHVDTTSLSVSGEYAIREKKTKEGQEEGEIPIAITYGYSRDHRADLQQWMLALATTHDGDVPVFMRPLDGNSSDKKSISDAVIAVMTQLRATLTTEGDERIAVFDSGGYSESNMTRYNEMKIKWISRVPETSAEAKKVIRYKTGEWLPLSDGSGSFTTRIMELPQGKERWVIMHTDAGEEAAKEQMEKKVKKSQDLWKKRLWHLSKQEFSCEDDALKAGKQALKGLPSYLTSSFTFQEERRYEQKGRPKKDTAPDTLAWRLIPSLSVDQTEVENHIRQQACFIIATNLIEEKVLGSEQVFLIYKEQGGVERGFRFLKDPLFLASSVFVKKPERIMALSFIMVLCLLIYRLAEHTLRNQLAHASQTVPNQVNKPTDRPTMRWIFQCFEGIDLLHICTDWRSHTQVLGLQPLHRQVLRLLGATYCQFYFLSP